MITLSYIHIIVGIIILLSIYYIYNNYFSKGLYPNKAKILIKDKKFDYIIDVRTIDEWNQGHLQNNEIPVLHIPIDKLVFDLETKVPNKDSRILFYCSKGIRASGSVEIAKRLGYKNIHYLIGKYQDLQ
jgi:rhodanese-related sulfurtransferase